MPLKRSLGLFETTMLGVGIIVGAGIYALVGLAGVQAGNALWLSFAIAGAIACLTALSYAELSSMYPRSGSSYYYSKHAFGSHSASFLLGWFVAITEVASASAVALGFGQYFSNLFPGVSAPLAAVGILVFVFIVNAFGVKQASGVNVVCSLLEVSGLILVLCLAAAFAGLFTAPNAGFASPQGFSGIVSGAALAFFAYLGFEIIATSAEEVKNPRKTLPRAMLLSIAICSVLYVAVAIAFTTMLPYAEIQSVVAHGEGALAVAAGAVGGPLVLIALSVIALFSTANTVLVSIFGASRMIYGMSEDKALPAFFNKTTKRGAPVAALATVSLVSIALAALGDLSFVAAATVTGMFVVFFADNLAVLVLRFKQPLAERGFRVPLSFKNVPLPTVAALVAIALIFGHELLANPLLAAGILGVIAVGIALFEGEARLAKEITHRKIRLGRILRLN
ncbi:MAG: amino acid permease [Candidatus Micrarchaeota archaeon]